MGRDHPAVTVPAPRGTARELFLPMPLWASQLALSTPSQRGGLNHPTRAGLEGRRQKATMFLLCPHQGDTGRSGCGTQPRWAPPSCSIGTHAQQGPNPPDQCNQPQRALASCREKPISIPRRKKKKKRCEISLARLGSAFKLQQKCLRDSSALHRSFSPSLGFKPVNSGV